MLDSVLDAVIVIDDTRRIALFNKAAEELFHCAADSLHGTAFDPFLSEQFRNLIEFTMGEFEASGWSRKYTWIEGLVAIRFEGKAFPVDGSMAPFKYAGKRYVSLILRDISIRQRAERKLRQMRQENARLQALVGSVSGLPEMIGVSDSMRRLVCDIQQVADTDSTILIVGETGTGKELVARAVHQRSRRKDKPLVSLNCAALSSGLIESELFGHEKGAFTGALARKLGRFELADGGTIFLDEIGEAPLDLQAKLLRVLQEGEFERVGGVSTRKVNARVIAATNRNLLHELKERRFREDLYYRLNVFPIHVPPLRERQQDIAVLAEFFINKYNRKIGRQVRGISRLELQALLDYDWPGNVRELEHMIERGVILSKGSELRIGDCLPRNESAADPCVGKTLEQHDREYILATLESTRWKVSGEEGAAKLLGLKPTTLEARMRKLGIQRPK